MKRLILTLILPLMLAAQTARYPSAIATTTDLTDLADRAQTTLSAALNSSATSFTVVSGSKFAAHMILTIDSEEIKICSVVGNTVSVGHSACPNVDGRGFAGTVAASHTNGTLVSNYIVAYQFKALREEIKAIETALGINMANAVTNPLPVDRGGTGAQDAPTARTNLGAATRGANSDVTSLTGLTTPLSVPQGGTGTGSVTGVLLGSGTGALAGVTGTARQELRVKPNQTTTTYEFATPLTVNAADYNFPAQTPGGSIAIGSNSVSLSPCPLGVNGTDTHHYVYLSGGTGSAEAVLITGGSCTSGATSGNIIVGPAANTHTGAWTVTSASGGIAEAANAISNQGAVTLPRTPITIRATTVLPTAVGLIGQGFPETGTSTGSILICAAAANPCLVLADGLGTATNQGFGIHRDYEIYGGGTGSGLWIGGDPSSVFAPTAWTGSYVRFDNVQVANFTNALYHRRGNFVTYNNCVFSGNTRAVLIPSDGGGEHQPVEFHGTLLSVASGAAVQMDDSGFGSNPVEFYGGQISGAITGANIFWETFGTHFEPNENDVGLLTATGNTAIVRIFGGLLSVHGTVLGSMLNVNGAGFYQITIKDVQAQADVGMVVTNFLTYSTSLGGTLHLENIDIAAAGVFTNLYSISKATLDTAAAVEVKQPLSAANTLITAGTTITFRQQNYPVARPVLVYGATVGGGITTIAGLTPYASGILKTSNAQTFTASATIGNTVTTKANLPYTYTSDGTQIWISAAPEWYTVGGLGLSGAHTVIGTCTLGTNCAVTLTGTAVFTDASHYVCTATDNTAAAATKIALSSGSAFTITGTATDVISFICVGN